VFFVGLGRWTESGIGLRTLVIKWGMVTKIPTMYWSAASCNQGDQTRRTSPIGRLFILGSFL
jgi:hypothetical protein